MNAHEIHALSGAYVLDALDAGERARFEDHLALCPACQVEVAGLREAAAVLPAVSAVTPPPALRDRLVNEIGSIRPLPPAAAPPTIRRASRRQLLAAAAVVAVVAAGGGVVAWQQTHTSASQSQADAVIGARDAQQVTVELTGGGSATVYRSASEHRAVLVTRGLRAAPSDRVYQLWLQREGRMVSAGLLTGSGDRKVVLDGDAATATGAGISIEPAGGSTEPTSAPIALFDFESAT